MIGGRIWQAPGLPLLLGEGVPTGEIAGDWRETTLYNRTLTQVWRGSTRLLQIKTRP
jgi:hypothetical protein